MPNPNIGKEGKKTRFSSENQPANPGRKKKIYTILKEQGYGADDIRAAFGELAFYTLDEIQEIRDDEEKPIIVRIVAGQFHTAYIKKDWTKIKDILEQVISKPTQKVVFDGAQPITGMQISSFDEDQDQTLSDSTPGGEGLD